MDQQAKLTQLCTLRKEVALLESELATEVEWPPKAFYTTYHVLSGMVLGMIGAASSLLFNVVGSVAVGQHPLELIRVYLTFPLGESALTLQDGVTLAVGCCLYLTVGMLVGVPFHLILSRFFDDASAARRFAVATVLSIGVWLVNFYGIAYWLQPMVADGRAWIIDQIPIYVAVLTHLAYGWTLLAVDQWGRFVPPGVATEEPAGSSAPRTAGA